MNKKRNGPAVLLLVAITAGCGADRSEPGVERKPVESVAQDVTELAVSYKDLRLMTPVPVFVDPTIAMLCSQPSKKLVQLIRSEYGPHANCSVRIFMNELASAAFEKQTSYPVGSIVVKEKQIHGYTQKGASGLQEEGNGVGGMVKREVGYDPANGDWEYFYFENSDAIRSGKIESCIACHKRAANTDYVFGNWAETDDVK